MEFGVSTGYVRSWATILVGISYRETKTLNTSSTNFDGARELMSAEIFSNANFFRSSILCYKASGGKQKSC